MTLKREIKDAYIEGGNSIYVKTHCDAVYVDDNETETLTQRLDNVKDSITEHTSQLNDITINIKQFGALGNGTTDDAESFIKAIDYCKNNNVFNLYIPSGTYIISKSITIDFPLNIYGVWSGNKISGTILKDVNTLRECLDAKKYNF